MDHPDIVVLAAPPSQDAVKQWITTWRPVRFHYRGRWRVGIVKAQVQLPDGLWALLIEHAADGMHSGTPAMVWAMHDPAVIVAIEDEAS